MEETLSNCSLFKGLKSSELTEIIGEIDFKRKKYEKDELVAYADAEVTNLLIVLEGSVRGEMMDFSGKTIKIEDVEAPNLLAPAFLFGNNNEND